MTLKPSERRKSLEIEAPLAQCGACHFGSRLHGTWSVEDGRLVWRGDADIQPNRGPDLCRCGEGSDCPDEFAYIVADYGDREFSSDEIAALRASADEARAEEMRRWREEDSQRA